MATLVERFPVSMPGQDEYGSPVTIITSTTYDRQGKPLVRTDAEDNETQYTYDILRPSRA